MEHSKLVAFAARGATAAFIVASAVGVNVGAPAPAGQKLLEPASAHAPKEHGLELVEQVGRATIAADGDLIRVSQDGFMRNYSFGLVRDMMRFGDKVAVLTSQGVSVTKDGMIWQKITDPRLAEGTGLTTHKGGYLTALLPSGSKVPTNVR